MLQMFVAVRHAELYLAAAYKSVGVCPTAASQKEPSFMKLVICQHLAASSNVGL